MYFTPESKYIEFADMRSMSDKLSDPAAKKDPTIKKIEVRNADASCKGERVVSSLTGGDIPSCSRVTAKFAAWKPFYYRLHVALLFPTYID